MCTRVKRGVANPTTMTSKIIPGKKSVTFEDPIEVVYSYESVDETGVLDCRPMAQEMQEAIIKLRSAGPNVPFWNGTIRV
jgi:hypothetical protein